MFSRERLFVFAGPNVIESEEHTLSMAQELKTIANRFDIEFVFKVSFDKANRSSAQSYRGPGLQEGLRILQRVKDEVGVQIITDVHEPHQVLLVADVVDVLQVPAFLCRQTDLLQAVARTGLPVHVKKGQFAAAATMRACVQKLLEFGSGQIILCERGTTFGYTDLVVDPRNLVWMASPNNLVSMDITHCLQRPSQETASGIVRAGGNRELIPLMGRVAIVGGAHGIFAEVHDRPDESLCDAPTQFPLAQFEALLTDLTRLYDIVRTMSC